MCFPNLSSSITRKFRCFIVVDFIKKINGLHERPLRLIYGYHETRETSATRDLSQY